MMENENLFILNNYVIHHCKYHYDLNHSTDINEEI